MFNSTILDTLIGPMLMYELMAHGQSLGERGQGRHLGYLVELRGGHGFPVRERK